LPYTLADAGVIHLFARFPALAKLPRAVLCNLPSPVEPFPGREKELWIKREDMNAPVCAGNKVRALEFLLGGLKEGDTVITTGGAGSTHVLATASHASRLGVTTLASRWTHDMNPVADKVAAQIRRVIPGSRVSWNPVIALAEARYRSTTKKIRYIPIGGTSPLGVLGHVNAALELSEQIVKGEMPQPSSIVLPLGSGGTAAGLLLGLAIAGLTSIEVVAARVGPRVFANRARVLMVAHATARLIQRLCGERVSGANASQLRVVHNVYGGAYGRTLVESLDPAKLLHRAMGLRLDDTYSAKAWTAAINEQNTEKGPVLFWLTFDPTCLTS
jgi:1-aminocyclopropane-1-carboxylate deaminase/D-cysteine desulfhydrase-like pyridoxal-dependent ACC family enzyme